MVLRHVSTHTSHRQVMFRTFGFSTIITYRTVSNNSTKTKGSENSLTTTRVSRKMSL
jgi:hypothetical protein